MRDVHYRQAYLYFIYKVISIEAPKSNFQGIPLLPDLPEDKISSPAYKNEWNRCNLIDLQVLIEIEREKKPNKALYNTDATYTKIWDKRNFERINQNFEP